MHLLTVSLFVLGLTGSLWTTLYALLLHQYERWDYLNALLEEVVYEVVVYDYVIPIMVRNLREHASTLCATMPPQQHAGGVYVQLRLALQLSPEEFETFVDRALHAVRPEERPFWFVCTGVCVCVCVSVVGDVVVFDREGRRGRSSAVQLRRLWHGKGYLRRRVREMCSQYPWRVNIVDDLLDHIEATGGGSLPL